MVHVTERAKEVRLERKRSANINHPEASLRLARSSGGKLALFADRVKAGDQVAELANREIPKARGEAARTITEADGYAIERVNRANGEATRFRAILDEYQRAPEVTRRRLYLEALGAILPGAKALYIVDGDQKALVPWLQLESGDKPAAGGK